VKNILNQLVEAGKHTVNHTFQDAWWVSQERGKVKVEVHFLCIERVVLNVSIFYGKSHTKEFDLEAQRTDYPHKASPGVASMSESFPSVISKIR
jgi:hypothetical protein